MLVFRDLTDYEGFEREQLAAGNVDGKSSWTTFVRGLKEEEREERGKNDLKLINPFPRFREKIKLHEFPRVWWQHGVGS